MQGMLLEIKLNRDGSMSVKKNITQQNSVFQIEKITKGKEEKVKFQEVKITPTNPSVYNFGTATLKNGSRGKAVKEL